ncbi:uncharacterized protein JCM15063_003207 [Sporobolomyces koalae]|uniref:uncharacterized protein n=1 Tax=Sporobolomyces koalae TaxID=500713 RepID=UPI003170616A
MATYDNGLYTPWTPAGEAQPAATSQPAPAWAATTTTQNPWWTAPTTSMSSSTTTTTTTPAMSSSSSSTTMASSSSSASASSSSSSSSSPSMSSSSSAGLSSAASSLISSSSSVALKPSGVIAASSSSEPPPSFKVAYLLPVFIIVPCVLLFLLAAWSYGKYWAKPRRDGQPSTRPSDQPGFWDAGAYKSIGGRNRSNAERDEVVDDKRDSIDDEKDGLVLGKDWAGDLESASPKKQQRPNKKWASWLPANPLARNNSTRSNSSSNHSFNHVPFVSVSYASLDQPFNPPANQMGRSASQMGARDRGWGWGTSDPTPQATTSALRVMNGDIDDDEQYDNDSKYLSAARGWSERGGSTTKKKYRAKKQSGSISSRISDKVMARLSPGGLGPNDVAPSPSVYSPQFPSPNPQPRGGAYAELEDEDEDEELDRHDAVDLDAYLGESRVGDGGLATRYLNGDPSAAAPPSRQTEAELAPAPFAVNLPSAPPRSQISPKKSQSTLLRVPPPEAPRATPPPQLLFGYDSPPTTHHARGPLPVPNSQSRSKLSGPSDPFTSPPGRIPFRSQAAPQISRPSRANSSTPFSPETAPALFFTSPPISSPPSSSDQYHFSTARHMNVVGSPMPEFQPGALRASESAFSIQGVDKLIFSDPTQPINYQYLASTANGKSRSESRQGLKEFVQKPKTRQQEIEELRKSVAPSVPGNPTRAIVGEPTDPIKPTITTKPVVVTRTESLGFNPVFSESPTLPPLQHPSRVRAAIETLEAKSSPVASSSGHSKSSSIDSTRMPPSPGSPTRPTRERLPTPPSPQKLERSTTTLGRTSRQHRTSQHQTFEQRWQDVERDQLDEERIQNRRVSTLLLSRSRTQSAGPTTTLTSSPSSSNTHGSTEDHGEVEREEERKRPLSSDPVRLQQMLRRKSTGANLGTTTEGQGPVTIDSNGTVGGGILEAMTRRSGIFD